ncbi:MAG TPA: SdrD B-like domain-containing protein [Gemmatimonadota bacterium]|nr:SdrD B-like domain-containing protein [Gemmatimonadota bacterium]
METDGRRAAAIHSERATRGRLLRLGLLALAMTSMLGGKCDPQGPGFFGIVSVPGTGDILGRVTVDGLARPEVVVILSQGATTVDTFVTDDNGRYEFLNLQPGTYTLSTTIQDADCGGVTASVVADQESEVDLPCSTPTTGTVGGQVTVNGSGEPGVSVSLRLGTTTLATTTTDATGTYQFSGVAPGPRTVEILPPSGVTCPMPRRNVSVTAGGTATADFACTRAAGDFSVNLATPPPGWNHDMPGVSSLECKVIRTSPAQAGATFSAQTTGPAEGGASGVLTPQPVTGTLNENGEAQLQVRINRTGTYINIVTVTSGAFQRTGSATVTVTNADNTCPVVSSSIRFKSDVLTLLSEDVRPLGLRPVAFRYVAPWGDPAVPQVGLIAEEVAEVFPEAVLLDAEGRPEAIDYGVLTGSVIETATVRAGWAIGIVIASLGDWF